jgi:hypothetical protein
MTHAERQARYRTKQAEGAAKLHYRKPTDRRSGLSGGVTPSLSYTTFRAIIRLGWTPYRKIWRTVTWPRPCARSATSTCQNWRASFRLGGLAATELLHDVKRDQIAARSANNDCTLIIINRWIG